MKGVIRLAAAIAAAVMVVMLGGRIWQGGHAPGDGAHRPPAGAAAPGAVLGEVLGDAAGTEGYARALQVRPFDFPADHGPHEDFRNEWWYFTGNLADASGRRFGYQLTFFRSALAPGEVASASRWRTRQVYMAHFALSDIDAGDHQAFERFGRGAAGIAGAENPPLRLWLDDWTVEAETDSGFPLRLRAAAGDVAIDLRLSPDKPPVLNGDRGLSRKSATPGNASYYYSLTRLGASGRVRTASGAYEVEGAGWLDREWSTSALGEDQAGWDWFALQLDDGRDLMLYRMRRKDGSTDPASAGTLVTADGRALPLAADELVLEVTRHWTSPRTGVRYPTHWRLALPTEGLSLEVEPLIEDQEMDTWISYWEGAVAVRGEQRGRALSGLGYMELAGYAGADTH